jgi:fibronectin type 3 domain-containing protein
MKKSLMIVCLCGALATFCHAQSSARGGGSVKGSGSVTVVVLAGHSVTLTWTASTSTGVTGYNLYRSQTSGGPYTQVNTSLISGTSYMDSSVTAGQTYYYVVTAVGSGGSQSSYSNQASAAVPSP